MVVLVRNTFGRLCEANFYCENEQLIFLHAKKCVGGFDCIHL